MQGGAQDACKVALVTRPAARCTVALTSSILVYAALSYVYEALSYY